MDNEDLLNQNFSGFSTATSSNFSISGEGFGITPAGTVVKFKKEKGMPAKVFFSLMKKKMGVLEGYSYKKRIKKIEDLISKTEASGQTAFSEELMKKLLVLCREAEMYANGKKIFLNREVFNKFKDATKKPIKLTALKNYARPIPQSVLDAKEKCDEVKLFDGYAIMHYDEAGVVKETEKEKIVREKDPILFGVVEYSDKLYFIDDWEDEYCDLTLDDIINELELKDSDITMGKKIKLN